MTEKPYTPLVTPSTIDDIGWVEKESCQCIESHTIWFFVTTNGGILVEVYGVIYKVTRLGR